MLTDPVSLPVLGGAGFPLICTPAAVDREFGPARESSAATSEIRQVVAHGDGCFVYVNTPDFKQFTGRRIAIHTLPDKLAIRQRAEAQPRKDKEVLGVWIQDIKDSRGEFCCFKGVITGIQLSR